MNRFSIAPSDAIVATVTGLIAAIAIIPFSVVALIVLAIGMLVKTRARIRSSRTQFAMSSLIGAIAIFGGILAAAALYRPAKIVEQQLDRMVNLPSTEMTLAELSYAATYERSSFPIRISFCFADDDKGTIVTWPRNDLRLREFLDAIESQSRLRRRFMHCGNGYTVLGGGDCCFGLYVRDPKLAVPPFPREQFDVDAYATSRDRQITKR